MSMDTQVNLDSDPTYNLSELFNPEIMYVIPVIRIFLNVVQLLLCTPVL